MTRMKHYRLGCGESLQSHWLELQEKPQNKDAADRKARLKMMATNRRTKKH
jgi:hypothetical protein